MRLMMTEKKKATAIVAVRYQKARKKEKGVMLDEFTKLTGYGRRYASYVLRCHGKKVWMCTLQLGIRHNSTAHHYFSSFRMLCNCIDSFFMP